MATFTIAASMRTEDAELRGGLMIENGDDVIVGFATMIKELLVFTFHSHDLVENSIGEDKATDTQNDTRCPMVIS